MNPRAKSKLERREDARRAERRSREVFAEVAVKMIEKKCKLPRPNVSRLEETFLIQLRASYGPALPNPDPAFFWQREWQFDAKRRWRFDFCWPSRMVAVELEGGVYSGGRHVRGRGFENDCEKMNAASLAGWKLGRFTSRMVDNGEALAWLRRALG